MGSAVQLNEIGEHSIGSQLYHPMYPVYNFNSQTSEHNVVNSQQHELGEPTTSAVPRAPGSISDDMIIQKY